ncbi:hypothetical protein C3B64_00975 [Clostridium botulinum]|uniref:Uncharacterized protein n=1 Tax=Clostridium botulinum TaxID=1491 RepID=A0AAU8YS31_CLOBO|nr:hypothetical protein [Clostridium sporogenes]AVP62902.1 hypothetical protein C3B64_00975 [Clostridium botulinum]MCF4018379.1 hypothetical protein [Clostridium sporogenes]NFG01899.1 hypothetical protein [Clostridium sporogenes]
MSGNESRRYKQYKLIQERQRLFGSISPRDEFGSLDLITFAASQGKIITSSSKLSLGKMLAKKNSRY